VRVLQIQGLRALAALLVTFFHAQIIGGGYVGVDIFYVISGYLITGLILREIDQTGKMNLSAFYQRRIKRLLPSSAFVLFSTAIVGWVILPETTRDALGRDLFAAAAYISNYLFAWWQNDYQNLNATPSPFIHYWSLAVEEQFYLLWPFFMLLLAKYGKQIIIPFNKDILIRATDYYSYLLPEKASSLQQAIYDMRSNKLEIYEMRNICLLDSSNSCYNATN
jgi:peptidoglycan/LPS O-acetylase OafA/YrhL